MNRNQSLHLLGVLAVCVCASRLQAELFQRTTLPMDGLPNFQEIGDVAVDGNRIAVGYPGLGKPGDVNRRGAVFIYERRGQSWEVTDRIYQTSPTIFNGFGSSVALDGNTLVVGDSSAYGDSSNPNGSAYVYGHTATGWQRAAELHPTGGLQSLGKSVIYGMDVDVDGNRIVVSAPGQFNGRTPDGQFFSYGAVYVFEHVADSWQQQGKIVSADAVTDFGASISLKEGALLVGAPGAGFNGRLYYFRDDGGWNQEWSLAPAGARSFGISVGQGGEYLFASDPNFGASANAGAFHVLHQQEGVLDSSTTFQPSGIGEFDQFGTSVSVDGDVVLVGSRFDSDIAYRNGAAYLLRRNNNTLDEFAKFVPTHPLQQHEYGSHVAFGNGIAVVSSCAFATVLESTYTWSPSQLRYV